MLYTQYTSYLQTTTLYADVKNHKVHGGFLYTFKKNFYSWALREMVSSEFVYSLEEMYGINICSLVHIMQNFEIVFMKCM